MHRLRAMVVVLLLLMMMMNGVRADDPPVVPADFKIQVGEFALKKEPVTTQDIVIRQGRAYVFASDSKEVMVIDPARKRVDLVDVGRRVQAEIPFRWLDESLNKIKANLGQAADDREKQGGRGNLIEARMTRDLFKTKLVITEGVDPHRVRLTKPAIEVDAVGEPDTDAARRSMTVVTLESIARVGAFKVPNDLPPFAELAAIAALSGDRKLRPTELIYLYRLNGPPRKFRRTYRMVPSLTDREVEATSRIDRLRDSVPILRYERYRTDR